MAALLGFVTFYLYNYYSSGSFLTKSTNYYNTLSYYKYIYNVVGVVINSILPFIIILTCSYEIQYDKNNSFSDIQKASDIKTHTYYLSKLVAYFTMFFILSGIAVALSILMTLISPECKMQINIIDMLSRTARNMFVIAIPGIITYISIAVALTLISNKVTVGIIGSIFYFFLAAFCTGSLYNIVGQFLFWMPNKLLNYLYYYNSPFMADFISCNVGKTSFNEALLSISLVITIDIVLLIAGYLCFKKRED